MSTRKRKSSPKDKRGPKPDHLQLDGDWREAAKKAVKKKRPKKWPGKKGI